jgi:hypothetical protein
VADASRAPQARIHAGMKSEYAERTNLEDGTSLFESWLPACSVDSREIERFVWAFGPSRSIDRPVGVPSLTRRARDGHGCSVERAV